MKKDLLIGITITLIILSSYVVVVYQLSAENAFKFIREDGVVENTQVLCYLASAVIWFYLFFKSRSRFSSYFLKTRMNWFYFFLGLFCVLILGEEISWGERIFNFKTAEKFQEAGGVSLHNRDYLFNLFGIPITAARIYFPFVLFYFVMVPFLNEYSQKINNFFTRISLPIVPMLVAVLTFINFSIWQVSYRFFDDPVKWEGLPEYAFFQTAEEVYEVIFALLLLWSCYSIYLNVRKKESVS